MNEKLKKIQEALESNPELKKQITENPPKTSADILAFAAQLGVELTEDELKASQEMSEEELETLAGGLAYCMELITFFIEEVF